MADRLLVWLSTGILTAGVSAAMLAGAGAAVAEDGASTGAEADSSSESADSVGAEKDSAGQQTDVDSEKPDTATDEAEPGQAGGEGIESDDEDAESDDDPDKRRSARDEDQDDKKDADKQAPDKKASVNTFSSVTTPAVESAEVDEPKLPKVDDEPPAPVDTVVTQSVTPFTAPPSRPEPKQGVVGTVVRATTSFVTSLLHPFASNNSPQTPAAQPQLWTLMAAARREFETAFETPALQAQPLAPQPSLINVIGSFAWGLFDRFNALIAGQPQVPPGSTVRVQRSTLFLDCGPGYTVDADWYFPTTDEPPTRLIYFQHGFPGSAVDYDYTAAELAERNNAIVVAPTITSDFFNCYGCSLGADPMHAAVGRLFIGEREALLASAKDAGFGGEALPERFVLMGHSGGGQLAGGAAGYFEEFAPDDEDDNLAGVILLDTSPIGGAIERGLAKIPEDIPVYTISAAPNFLNSQGAMNKALVAARPGQFVGVELVNGTHGDGFNSHNPIVELGGQLFSMAFSRPENREAVQVLTQGWINDFYEGTEAGVYGELGSTVDIPGAGGARAYVLPAPAPQLTFIHLIIDVALRSTAVFQIFQTCAEDPSAPSSSDTASCTTGRKEA